MFGSDMEAIAERAARCEAELAILDACAQGIRNGRALLAEEIRRLLASGYKHRPGFPATFAELHAR